MSAADLSPERVRVVRRLLTAANAGLTPTDRRKKFRLLAADSAAFFRGTNQLYWATLGRSPALDEFGGGGATRIWLQGDCHVGNFGAFADAHGTVVYDLNDFDEAVLGDYQLDLWRLAASLVLTLRANGGFSAEDEDASIAACLDGYLDELARQRDSGGESRTFTAATTYGQLDDFLERTAQERSPAALLTRFTEVDATGQRRFILAGNPDLTPPAPAVAAALRRALPAYGRTLGGGLGWDPARFAIGSVARRRNSGIGASGVPRYYLLITGAGDGPQILEVKAQPPATALPYLDPASRRQCAGHQGRRVVLGTRALGHASDDYLGWLTVAGRAWSVRRRSPWKAALDTHLLTTPRRVRKMAEQWGAVLAAAHGRADGALDRSGPPFAVGVGLRTRGRREEFAALVARLGRGYADQALADYAVFLTWGP